MEDGECKRVRNPRFSKCQLSNKGLPSEVYDIIEWDVIMIDGLKGYFDEAPGKMREI
ncbi:unnamed protein product [Lupinus luteus]|uniref:Uncharacterized protein n=1 Tax=Lupinus luteus TaxID=3873 RepID=A0AAV1X0D0_LUPLU